MNLLVQEPVVEVAKVVVKETIEDVPAIEEDRFGSYFQREIQELKTMANNGTSIENRPLHIFKSGATYKGQWRGNSRHGKGTQRWPDGAFYQGEWKDSCADGRGYFKHSDGDIYVGEWQGNVADGK